MKRILLIIALLAMPFTAYAWDSNSSYSDHDEYSRKAQQQSDQRERQYISDNMKRAVENNDRNRMDSQQRAMDHQLFMERMRSR